MAIFWVSLALAAGEGDRAGTIELIPQLDGRSLADNWKIVSFVLGDPNSGKTERYPEAAANGESQHIYGAVIDENTITIWIDGKKLCRMPYEIDAGKTPCTIDAKYEDRKMSGICKMNGDGREIAAVNVAGEKRLESTFSTEKTAGVQNMDTHVAWSSDSRSVLSCMQRGDDRNSCLYSLDLDGQIAPAKLSHQDLHRGYSDPSCSLDGKKIAASTNHISAAPPAQTMPEKKAEEDPAGKEPE